jgi:hypothetical protein
VKNHQKSMLLPIIILLFITMGVGCNDSNPVIPGIEPNPAENPENDTVSNVKVSASSSSAKVNETIQLVVKGYNSDDEWVILDKSKIKLWKWTVQGQCYSCIEGAVGLTPKAGSLTTTFTSGVTGTFFIAAYYRENATDGYITDYIEIKVTK